LRGQEFLRQQQVGLLEQLVAMRRNSSGVLTKRTPRENEPSGIFTNSGRPSSPIAFGRSAASGEHFRLPRRCHS
jgi:hypothetical protein